MSTIPPTHAISIRPFAPRDQPAARWLILDGLGEHFGAIDETRNPDLDDIVAHYIAPGHTFLIAERAGALIGTAALMVAADATAGQIVRVSVAREQRRLGLGRLLIAHLLTDAHRRGLRRLVVETNDDWHNAIALYENCGFAIFARHSGSVYLERHLSPSSPRLA
jgi:ribosomal protein S18 acetylase RimI-like enzyme